MMLSDLRQRVRRIEAALQLRAARMTQRERFLVTALAVIILSCIVILPFLEAADARDRLVTARAQMTEAAALSRRAEVAEQDPVERGAAELAGMSLQAASLSLARIALEQFVVDTAAASELTPLNISIGNEFETDRASRLLRVNYTVSYDPGRFYNMLQGQLAADHAVFIDRIEVTGDVNQAPPSFLEGDSVLAPEGFTGPTSGQARVELLVPVAIEGGHNQNPPGPGSP